MCRLRGYCFHLFKDLYIIALVFALSSDKPFALALASASRIALICARLYFFNAVEPPEIL